VTVPSFASIRGVAEVRLRRGRAAPEGAAPDLLLEVPHGATKARHFDALLANLRGPFPEGLRDFFFVNTDVGAPELAARVAARVVASDPRRAVLVVRALVPRTFVDLNRVIDERTAPSTSGTGGVTPGIVSYVRDPGDLALLLARYHAYRDLVERAYATVVGGGGRALMLHSYAPREVDVPVDERIVERLRDAYRPEKVGTWPLRAEVDLITTTPDGTRLADSGLAAALRAAFERSGLRCAEGAAYALHPATMAHRFAERYPGRTLCLEVRRDLLVRAFTPFAEMEADPAKVDRVAACLAE